MPISHRKIPEKNQEISDCSFGWSTCGQCAILLTHVILLIITSGVHPAGEGGESPNEEIYRVVPKY